MKAFLGRCCKEVNEAAHSHFSALFLCAPIQTPIELRSTGDGGVAR